VPIYGFDEDSAKRIGQTVRLVEGSRTGKREPGVGNARSGAAAGVRCMAGTIGSSSWGKDSYSTVTIYSGEPESESTAGTISAYNYISDIPAGDTDRWVAVSNNGYGWLLIESPVASDFFRMATFEGDWETDATAVVTFSGIYSAETATAVNYFCNIAGGDVGLCRNAENVWHLVSWEMGEVCTAQIIDVQVNLSTTDCAITRTLVTTEQRFLRLTYPYADCSTTP